jgi:AcrR family transcriptional regulator
MVAAVAELGYGATRVADVSGISGVSSRSFYNLFPGGKDECFLSALDQILDGTLATLSAAGEEEKEWEQRLQATYTRFAEIVAAQPATASLILTEAYAAGPVAVDRLERATSAFERLSRRRLKESPERAGLPSAMIEAQVGALQELARTRVRRSEADALQALVPELVDLVAGYRPPPERLRLSTRRSSYESEIATSPDEAERAIRGFILAVAEHGYASATIQQIARQGGMSTNTFYANFRDKRTALTAAIDSSTAQLQALAMAAYRRSPGWASGVRAMIGSALSFLASRPATASILLVEVYAGGSEALHVRQRGVREMARVLDEGRHENTAVPAITAEVITGGIVALARRHFLRKGAESLPSLAPIATYIALAPYLGAAEACAAANGDGRGRQGTSKSPRLPQLRMDATKWSLNSLLGARWATAEELAAELGRSVASVEKELEELGDEGLAERIVPLDKAKPTEWTNSKMFRLIDGEDWAALTVDERRRFLNEVTHHAISDLYASLRNGRFGRRLDEHHTRLVLEVDEEGWGEIAQIHRAAFNATQAVKERSRERLRNGSGEAILGRSIQLLFEVRPEDL